MEAGVPVDAGSSQRIFEQMSRVYAEFLEAFEDTQRRAAFATVNKHALSHSASSQSASIAGFTLPTKGQQSQPTQQVEQQAASQQNQSNSQPPQINLQNQQQQQQQYLQNMHQLQAQAQANMQRPPTPQQPPNVEPTGAQPVGQHQRGPSLSRNDQGQSVASVQAQSAQPLQGSPQGQTQTPQGPPNKLPNLPAPSDLSQARAEIEEWKNSLLQSKRKGRNIIPLQRADFLLSTPAKCTRLEDFDPADADKFVNMAKSLAPMVDRIVELLPLYLAISQQPQGAYRLLVMVSL